MGNIIFITVYSGIEYLYFVMRRVLKNVTEVNRIFFQDLLQISCINLIYSLANGIGTGKYHR